MSSIKCPHCGAQNKQSNQTNEPNKIQTCPYCSQTFLLEAALEKKQALIHHGQTIQWQKKRYRPQGFIQFKHDEGYRTEWWMLNDNDESYWLSVDDENLFLMQDNSCDNHFPPWDTLQVNRQLSHQDQTYLVTEKRLLHYVKTEGILPHEQTEQSLKYTYLTGQNAQCLLLMFTQHSVSCRQGYWLDPFEIEVIT